MNHAAREPAFVHRRAGVEAANLANNHGYDHGPEALLDSVWNLRRAGIAPVRAGRGPRRALAPAMFDLESWRVAVVGLGMVIDPPEQVAAPATRGRPAATTPTRSCRPSAKRAAGPTW